MVLLLEDVEYSLPGLYVLVGLSVLVAGYWAGLSKLMQDLYQLLDFLLVLLLFGDLLPANPLGDLDQQPQKELDLNRLLEV